MDQFMIDVYTNNFANLYRKERDYNNLIRLLHCKINKRDITMEEVIECKAIIQVLFERVNPR